jgi:hypothetical protein
MAMVAPRRIRRWLAGLVLTVSSIALSGCGQSCSGVLYLSGLELSLDQTVGQMPGLVFDHCLDDVCGRAESNVSGLRNNPVYLAVPFDSADEVELRITAIDRDGVVVAAGEGRVTPALVEKSDCDGWFADDRYLVRASLLDGAVTPYNGW